MSELTQMLLKGLLETLYMTLLSTALAYLIGLPLGVTIAVIDPNGLHPMRGLKTTLDVVINLLRSIPFLILLIAIQPFTRMIVGTTIGSTATIVPLVLGAAPLVARVVETSLKDVDRGVIEAASSMGARPMQIVFKVMLAEARPSLLLGVALSAVTILGYSAMAGIVAGGGLGDIAIRFGYYRYERDTMFVTVMVLIVVVQIIQEIGARAAKLLDKRIK